MGKGRTRTRGFGSEGRMQSAASMTKTKTPPKEVDISWELEQLEQLEDFGTVQGENGRFIKVPTPFGVALVKDRRPQKDITSTIIPSGLRIPKNIYEATLGFFRHIYETMKTEAVVLYYYNTREPEWQVVVPWQKCSGGQASYDLSRGNILNLVTGQEADIDNTKGWVLGGSAHSHPGFGAFWSGGDDANELPINGIHVTMGYIMRDVPDLACSIVVRHTRFVMEAHDVFEIDPLPSYAPPQSVLANVMKEVTQTSSVTTTKTGTADTKSSWAPQGGKNLGNLPGSQPLTPSEGYGSHRGSPVEDDDDTLARLRAAHPDLWEDDLALGGSVSVPSEIPMAPEDIELLAELERQDAGINTDASGGPSNWNSLLNR